MAFILYHIGLWLVFVSSIVRVGLHEGKLTRSGRFVSIVWVSLLAWVAFIEVNPHANLPLIPMSALLGMLLVMNIIALGRILRLRISYSRHSRMHDG